MQVIGPYVDLTRSVRSLRGLAEQTTFALGGGKLANVPRALQHERSALRGVFDDASRHPDLFTGAPAPDVLAGARLLDSARDRITAVMDAAGAAIDVDRSRRTKVVLAELPVARPDAGSVRQELQLAATEVEDAYRLFGGARALPDYEDGPPPDRSTMHIAPLDSEAVVAPGHRATQALGRGLMHVGLRHVLGVRAEGPVPTLREAPAVFAATHEGNLDPSSAVATVDGAFRPIAKAGLFKIKVLGSLIRLSGAIPVKHGDAEAGLATARAVLAKGESLWIYPSGMLLHAGIPGSHGSGAGRLAAEMGVDIIPVGSHGSGPRRLRGEGPGRRLVSLVYGDRIAAPASPTKFNQALMSERLARAVDELKEQARAAYQERRDAAVRHRPVLYGGVAAATLGVGALAYARAKD